MDASFTNRVVDCDYAHQIWAKIESYFTSKTHARVRKLRAPLKSVKKKEPVSAYLLKIKKIVDTLVAVGALVTTEEHIEVILHGLNFEYVIFIIAVVSRSNPYAVDEIRALMLAHKRKELKGS